MELPVPHTVTEEYRVCTFPAKQVCFPARSEDRASKCNSQHRNVQQEFPNSEHRPCIALTQSSLSRRSHSRKTRDQACGLHALPTAGSLAKPQPRAQAEGGPLWESKEPVSGVSGSSGSQLPPRGWALTQQREWVRTRGSAYDLIFHS